MPTEPSWKKNWSFGPSQFVSSCEICAADEQRSGLGFLGTCINKASGAAILSRDVFQGQKPANDKKDPSW